MTRRPGGRTVEAEQRRRRFPGAGWLSARLSRKMILILLTVAVLGWLLSIVWFLQGMGRYVEDTYDQTMAAAQSQTRQVVSFLEGSQGELDGLEGYLSARNLGCTIQDGGGAVIFQYSPDGREDVRLAVSSAARLTLPSGESLSLRVWCPTMGRQDLRDLVSRRAFWGLILFNLALFAAAGVLLYLLIVAPIVELRRIMRAYSERGTQPPRSLRTDEVGKLQNTFADLTGVLRAKEQSERRMIASISHDIKTPLTSVLGYSERLLSASLPPEKRERYLRGIHDKGVAIQSVVDEFDDYLEAGLRDQAAMELVSAGRLCQELCREYREELLDANVKLEVQCACPRAELICNMAHMRRYFGNLIGNSIRHSGAERLELTVVCRQEGDALILEFADNGKGVPPELLQQIFEPLYTSDRGRKVSGLGLSICRGIIRGHGGTVAAENRPQGGLLIRALLPCART